MAGKCVVFVTELIINSALSFVLSFLRESFGLANMLRAVFLQLHLHFYFNDMGYQTDPL